MGVTRYPLLVSSFRTREATQHWKAAGITASSTIVILCLIHYITGPDIQFKVEFVKSLVITMKRPLAIMLLECGVTYWSLLVKLKRTWLFMSWWLPAYHQPCNFLSCFMRIKRLFPPSSFLSVEENCLLPKYRRLSTLASRHLKSCYDRFDQNKAEKPIDV